MASGEAFFLEPELTICIISADNKTLSCCPSIPTEGLPTVLVVMTSGSSCMRAQITAESAMRLGAALSEAGRYIDPHAAVWQDREEALTQELAE